MYLKIKHTILAFFFIPLLTTSIAKANPAITIPITIISKYMNSREEKDIKNKLEQIEKNLADVQSDIKLMLDSDLNAAMSALNDAKQLISAEEKADSIRSAKHFLTKAVNISKEPDRKALAYYLLGHVYLLLNEEAAAKSQFKKVVHFKYGTLNGLWNKETSYNKAITQLKRDASGILCSYLEHPKDIKEDWCALHIGYLNASKIELNDLENCLHTEKKVSCERVGFDLLKQYLKKHDAASAVQSELKIYDSFDRDHREAIQYSKSFISKSCDDPSLSKEEHVKACYRHAQVLFHEGKFGDAQKNYRLVCNHWFNTLRDSLDQDDPLQQIGAISCQALYREPLWSEMSETHRLGIVKRLCLSGDLQACGQLISAYHFYHDKIINNVSKYVAKRCLIQEDQDACDLIGHAQPKNRNVRKFSVKSIIVGRTSEGKLWDLTGDSNPEVLLEIFVGKSLVYHQQLIISQITSDAAGNPLTYQIKPEPAETLLIDQEFALKNDIRIVVSDIDPMSDDLIGELEVTGGLKPLKISFGAVSMIELDVVTATP